MASYSVLRGSNTGLQQTVAVVTPSLFLQDGVVVLDKKCRGRPIIELI